MTTILTDNNHFRFGWNGGTFNVSGSHSRSGDFWVKLGQVDRTRRVGSFRQEVLATCDVIAQYADDLGKEVVIAASGGIDSEIICQGFRDIGAPFGVAIVRFAGGLNDHDTQWIADWCVTNGVPQHHFDLDIEHFFRTELSERWKVFPATLPFHFVQMWLIEKMAEIGFPVMGGGDLPARLLRWRNKAKPPQDRSGFFWYCSTGSVMPMQYAHDLGIDSAAAFYAFTPSIMAAFLEDPDVQHFLRYEESLNWATMLAFKGFFLHRHFPGIKPRLKATGYERIDDREFRDLLDRLNAQPGVMGEVRIDVPEFRKMLGLSSGLESRAV